MLIPCLLTGRVRGSSGKGTRIGAKDCTPEIVTSEIIVDFQWHFQMEFHLSVVCSKGLTLLQWIITGSVQWTFSGLFEWNFTLVISGAHTIITILTILTIITIL